MPARSERHMRPISVETGATFVHRGGWNGLILLHDRVIHAPSDVVHKELTIGAVHHEVERRSNFGDGSPVQ
jgi:hypothetical protein